MSAPLQIGSFVFDIDDLPTQIELGGTQVSSIYQYPGGVKDVQLFGAIDDTITISGTFNYNAEHKAAIFDKWFRQETQLTVSVGNFESILAVITKYKPTYRSPYAIDYKIDLEPLTSYVDKEPASLIVPVAPTSKSSHPSTSTTRSSNTHSVSHRTTSSSPNTTRKPTQRIYIVKQNDNLWNIAKKYYGTGTVYSKIVTANKLKTTKLQPGQRLVIP